MTFLWNENTNMLMTFDDEGRYLLNGRPYVRVTKILRPLVDRAVFVERDLIALAHHVVANPRTVVVPDNVPVEHHADNLIRQIRSSNAAQLGTEIHEQTARADSGRAITAHFGVVNSYLRACNEHGLTVAADSIERTVVHDDNEPDYWGAGFAGTFDRIFETNDGRRMIADIKTGRVNWLAVAAQLAAYAHAPSIVVDGNITPWDKQGLDQHAGLVIHIDVPSEQVEIYEIELFAGWEAFKACCELWELNSDRVVYGPYNS